MGNRADYEKERRREDMNASECKCCECGGRAVAFWPVVDVDIPSYPYCRECVEEAKRELMVELLKDRKKK